MKRLGHTYQIHDEFNSVSLTVFHGNNHPLMSNSLFTVFISRYEAARALRIAHKHNEIHGKVVHHSNDTY